MKPFVKLIVILLVLLGELAWAVRPRFSMHGPVLEEAYRHDERFATLVAWSRDQTPASKAAYDAEVRLLEEHITRRDHCVFAAALAINALGIYSFWSHAPIKPRA